MTEPTCEQDMTSQARGSSTYNEPIICSRAVLFAHMSSVIHIYACTYIQARISYIQLEDLDNTANPGNRITQTTYLSHIIVRIQPVNNSDILAIIATNNTDNANHGSTIAWDCHGWHC